MSCQLFCLFAVLVAAIQAVSGNGVNLKPLDSMRENRTVSYMNNVGCDAYEQITGTDNEHHTFLPYYVKLFRCQGADATHAPTHRTCEPIESQEVNVGVIENGVHKVITLLNHTKCEYQCKKKTCNAYQKWNEDTCACDCDPESKVACHPPKVWGGVGCCKCSYNDALACENMDKVMNEKTCRCEAKTKKATGGNCNENSIDISSLITIVTLEFIMVVILCSFVFYCCCHKRNHMNKMAFNNHCLTNTKLMLRLSEDSIVENV